MTDLETLKGMLDRAKIAYEIKTLDDSTIVSIWSSCTSNEWFFNSVGLLFDVMNVN
jgi:hypothetical protein